MNEPENIIGPCPLCGRDMIAGKSVNEHHLLPKSLKGRETVTIHVVCHTKIHSVFTERELFAYYHTPERLREHPEIQKFLKWISKKPPEYRTRNRATNEKIAKKRRRR